MNRFAFKIEETIDDFTLVRAAATRRAPPLVVHFERMFAGAKNKSVERHLSSAVGRGAMSANHGRVSARGPHALTCYTLAFLQNMRSAARRLLAFLTGLSNEQHRHSVTQPPSAPLEQACQSPARNLIGRKFDSRSGLATTRRL
jgi:hypothetical protein